MRILVASLIVVGVTTLSVAAMLLVRRKAPEGSYFRDGDRASGVFGVLATGFSVLLGFIIFLAFQSYDESRSGAESEATIVAQQVQTAQFLPPGAVGELTGDLICYARSVVGPEWDALQSRQRQTTRSTPGAVAMYRDHLDGPSDALPPSSRRTTGGWTRRRNASRPASLGYTAIRGSSRRRCGWFSSWCLA